MFLDSYAWIAYFAGEAGGEAVREIIEGDDVLYTSPIVLAEVTSRFARSRHADQADAAVEMILSACAIVEHTAGIGRRAGHLHATIREEVPGFGMADALVLAAARSREVDVLTGDPHFETLEDAVMLEA